MTLLLFSTFHLRVFSQNYTVSIEPITINGAPALHSGAWAQWQGTWLLLGGRTNGLHGFQPFSTFPLSGANDSVFVVDPRLGFVASAWLGSLPKNVREQVASSNMQFAQDGATLYVTGGYGWDADRGDFRTFPALTAIDIPGLIAAVVEKTDPAPHFRQMSDDRMAVCGGAMEKIGDEFCLAFGHKFDGTYSIEETGFFTQEYTRQIRRFRIENSGNAPQLLDYSATTDSAQFRRRDYNLVRQIFPDRQPGLTAFSGVFRKDSILPHLSCINIGAHNYAVAPDFEQLYSHYHSAAMPLYDSTSNTMHTIFFGGTAMYFPDSLTGRPVRDSLVPFVRTVSMTTRRADGTMTETVLPFAMPELLGTNAYFIPVEEHTNNGVVQLGTMRGKTLAGWIFGGIVSPKPHISEESASLSSASTYIFRVWVDSEPDAADEPQENREMTINCFPAVPHSALAVRVWLPAPTDVRLTLSDATGRAVGEIAQGLFPAGQTALEYDVSHLAAGLYFLRLDAPQATKFVRVLLPR